MKTTTYDKTKTKQRNTTSRRFLRDLPNPLEKRLDVVFFMIFLYSVFFLKSCFLKITFHDGHLFEFFSCHVSLCL